MVHVYREAVVLRNPMPPTDSSSPLSRPCPRCGALAYRSCVRIIGARVAGKETGGEYTKRLKRVHDERKNKRG